MSRKTRKLMWSVPIVAVLAIVGALAMFAALTPGSASADMLPDAPMNLKVTAAEGNAGRTTLVLNWDAAANATGYRIDKSQDGFMWETMMMDTGSTATTYMDTTLTASDSRWYRVFARNSHGVSTGFDYARGGTKVKGMPGPVQNLRAVPNSKNEHMRLNLSWDPPADNGGEKIVGYEIQFHNGTEWTSFAASPTAGDTTKQTGTTYEDMVDVDPGDSKNYRVRAVNGTNAIKSILGEAADVTAGTVHASEMHGTAIGDAHVSKDWVMIKGTTQAAEAPGQVTGLAAVANGAQVIDLYWHTPADDGGWPITDYLIQVRREGQTWPDMPTAAQLRTGSQTPATPTLGDTGIERNATGYVAAATAGTPQLTQASFTGIVALDLTEGDTANAVQQRWEFRVFALTTDNGVNNTAITDDVIRRSSSPSYTAFATAAARPSPDNLAGPTLAATNRDDGDDEEEQIDLTITAPGTPPVNQSAYRIDVSEDGGTTWMALVADTRFTNFGADRPYEHVNLPYDATRHYRAFAHDGGWRASGQVGEVGLVSANEEGSTSASTAPGKVTGLMASISADRKSITASWTAPTDDGGQPITKYEVQYTEDDGDGVVDNPIERDFRDSDIGDTPPRLAAVTYTTKDAATMATFDVTPTAGLKADSLYFVRVRAVNKEVAGVRTDGGTPPANTEGSYSDVANLPTSATAAPNMVEGLTSKVAVDTNGDVAGVLLLWNEASSGSDATSYQIARKIGDGDWEHPSDTTLEYEEVGIARTDYTDSRHHVAGEMLAYRVRAKNAAGESDWSMVYYPRDPGDHEHNVAPMAPTAALAAQTVAEGMSVTVQSTITDANMGDTLTWTEMSTDDMIASSTVDNMGMVTITGVAAGSATITVTATDAAGESAMQTIAVTVEAAMLGAPSGVTAVVDETDPRMDDVIVSWTPGEGADSHDVVLYSSGPAYDIVREATDVSGNSHKFDDLDPGRYAAVVISARGADEWDYALVWVEVR
ncbi:MAG: fibronectin type III domain-containing protein [Chloroflexi bacterium]|nr:fibronectin type III domain-containing protein [Chloroflexota bacterium]